MMPYSYSLLGGYFSWSFSITMLLAWILMILGIIALWKHISKK